MSDEINVTKTTSYWENVKNSFAGVIAGIIFFIASILLLWFNEGHYAAQTQIASYIKKNAQIVDVSTVNREFDNKLISTSGELTTAENLSDGIVSRANTLVLNRNVEMYQWEEDEDTKTQTKTGGQTTETTTYKYKKVWSSKEIDSANFHDQSHSNPPFPIQSERINAKNGKFGAYNLSEIQTAKIYTLTPYSGLPNNYKYRNYGNYYYGGHDIENPKIGDVRIFYEYAPSGTKVSLIGQQRSDDTITPMILKKGRAYIQYDGMLSKNEMVQKFKKDNLLLTNLLRLAGFVIMLMGLCAMVEPASVILSFLPILQKIASFFTTGIAVLVALAISLLVIALAWLFYRPFLTLGLIVLIAGIVFLIYKKINTKQEQ